jgi:hypothetical protein
VELRTKNDSATRTNAVSNTPRGKGGPRELRQRMVRALNRARGQGSSVPGVMPSTNAKAAPGHDALAASRQKLVMEALRLGVLEAGKTPDAVGKPGRGQFRSWRSLGAAVERARVSR